MKRKKKKFIKIETVEEFIERGGEIKKKETAYWTKTRLMFSSRHFHPNKRTRGNQKFSGL